MSGDVHVDIEVRGKLGPRYQEIVTPQALAFLAGLHRKFNGTRQRLLARREERQARFDAGELPDFLPETQPSAPATGRSRRSRPTFSTAASRSPGRPTARWSSTRSTPARASSWPTSRTPPRRPGTTSSKGRSISPTAGAASSTFTDPASGKGLQALRQAGRAPRAPARLAPAGRPPAHRQRTDVRFAVRFRPLRLPQRAGHSRAGQRTIFLSAQDGEPPRGAPVERGVPPRRGGARPSRRHHQGDRADRDAARRLRDGRNHLRTARAHGRPQLRPLGLHLLVHQDAPEQAATTCCRTVARSSWARPS